MVRQGKVKESELAQSCPSLCHPMDCGLPGSSIHGVLQASVLEWVAIAFSRGSSWPRDWTQVSHIAGKRFTLWANRETRKKKIKTNNSEYEEVAAGGTWGSILLGTLWGTTLDNCRHFPTNAWRNWAICTLPLILIGWGPPVGRVSPQPFQFALHLSWTSPMVPERTFGPRERGPHTEMGTSYLSQLLVKPEEGTGGWAGYSYNILFFIWFPGVQCIF